ncbi:hypothetical protein QFC21_005031 [Naganishia friedmannii]|uniref:Uncharacterized protein n=1 Tax=Naganishia friedmannii TaxID=89922 RepID=A0ACC2VDR6_9TREE|nr:hypothetical protein QFC21_005031 [Naganishia friedmannii]
MTSGSTAKAHLYLRNSFLRVAALLIFVCSLTTLLAMQLTPPPQAPQANAHHHHHANAVRGTRTGVGFLRRGVGYARDTTGGCLRCFLGNGGRGNEDEDVEEEEEEIYLDLSPLDDDDADGETPDSAQRAHAKRKEWVEYGQQEQQHAQQPVGEKGWCSEAEYLDGSWVLRDELVTPETIGRAYKYTDKGKLRCQSRYLPPGAPQPSPEDAGYSSRIWETAQYVWTPKNGCKKHVWTRWAFAKYCLRARAGCSVLTVPLRADSLADQLYVVIREAMVSNHASLFEIHASTELIFNITVNRLHPDAPRLALEAGVSWDRLERPLFYYWREHHLLQREELDDVFRKAVGYRAWTGGVPYRENGWIWDRSWWLELWRGELGKPLELLPTTAGAGAGAGAGGIHHYFHAPREEKSVISFSSGPHWTTTELWPRDGWVTRNFDELLRGWAGMFNKVTNHVNDVLGDGHKVLAWWRSSVPGHFECWQYDKQLTPCPAAPYRKLYPFMDDYASSRTQYKPSNSTHRIGSRHGMQYMDLWTFSVKRPDAHAGPLIYNTLIAGHMA